jgi:hypothetical protein
VSLLPIGAHLLTGLLADARGRLARAAYRLAYRVWFGPSSEDDGKYRRSFRGPRMAPPQDSRPAPAPVPPREPAPGREVRHLPDLAPGDGPPDEDESPLATGLIDARIEHERRRSPIDAAPCGACGHLGSPCACVARSA